MRPLISTFTALFVLTVGFVSPAWANDSSAAPLQIISADHAGVWHADRVEWRSRFSPHLTLREAPQRLVLALPLPREAQVTSESEAAIETVQDAEGRVVAIDFVDCPPVVCAIDLRTVIPRDVPVDPPLASGAQRLSLKGARFRPNGPTPVKLRLTSARHEGVSAEIADRIDAEWGDIESGRPIFVLPDDAYVSSGGIGPHLVDAEDAGRMDAAFFGGGLVVVLGLLAGMFHLASRGAKTEAAEAFLRDFQLPGPAEEET